MAALSRHARMRTPRMCPGCCDRCSGSCRRAGTCIRSACCSGRFRYCNRNRPARDRRRAGEPGLPVYTVMLFPALFTAGMTLIDSTDNVLMIHAYGWAMDDPQRKLLYNASITFVGGRRTGDRRDRGSRPAGRQAVADTCATRSMRSANASARSATASSPCSSSAGSRRSCSTAGSVRPMRPRAEHSSTFHSGNKLPKALQAPSRTRVRLARRHAAGGTDLADRDSHDAHTVPRSRLGVKRPPERDRLPTGLRIFTGPCTTPR